jgi:hypothetical protein
MLLDQFFLKKLAITLLQDYKFLKKFKSMKGLNFSFQLKKNLSLFVSFALFLISIGQVDVTSNIFGSEV